MQAHTLRTSLNLCIWACAAAGLFLYGHLRKRRYGGLESLVSYSARIIAALRAIETRKGRDLALIMDPLAEQLAGSQAMAEVLKRYPQAKGNKREQGNRDNTDAPSINRLILRTLLVDDFVRISVGAAMSPKDKDRALKCPMLSDLATWLSSQSTVCKQVVLLGAGMDTRAWRLALPDGVQWWEVDVQEVINAKRTIMEKAGASFSVTEGKESCRLQLQCSLYASVPDDLLVPGWASRGLIPHGFDPRAPTAWVVEGLLYYLQPDTVPTLLKEAASVSGPGSCLTASIVGESVVQRLQEKQRSGENKGRPLISSAFLWGCPGDPAVFFAQCGWHVLDAQNWVDIAESMGLHPELGDQKKIDDTTIGIGEAPIPSTDPATIKAERRARSAYLVARIQS